MQMFPIFGQDSRKIFWKICSTSSSITLHLSLHGKVLGVYDLYLKLSKELLMGFLNLLLMEFLAFQILPFD